MRWYMWSGTWWMLQWSTGAGLSLGMHVDWRRRPAYGPYVDLHLFCAVLSLGRCPRYTDETELVLTYSRGGVPHG